MTQIQYRDFTWRRHNRSMSILLLEWDCGLTYPPTMAAQMDQVASLCDSSVNPGTEPPNMPAQSDQVVLLCDSNVDPGTAKLPVCRRHFVSLVALAVLLICLLAFITLVLCRREHLLRTAFSVKVMKYECTMKWKFHFLIPEALSRLPSCSKVFIANDNEV